jgi:hypothetical protein
VPRFPISNRRAPENGEAISLPDAAQELRINRDDNLFTFDAFCSGTTDPPHRPLVASFVQE